MANIINRDKPHVSFSGVITTLITLGTLIASEEWITTSYLPSWFNQEIFEWAQTLFFIGIYLVLALSKSDFKAIGDVMAHILTINKENSMNDLEKVLLIRDQLELFSGLFSKLFTEVRAFKTRAGENWHLTRMNLKSASSRIIKGSISLIQSSWILLYIGYLVLIKTNFFEIALPFNIILIIVFNFGLCLTSPNIGGIGEMIKDLFQVANSGNSDESSLSLKNIIHTIRLLCLNYSRIADRIERLTGLNVKDVFLGTCTTNNTGETSAAS